MSKLKILYVNSPKYDLITALHIEGLLKCEDVDVRFTSLGNYAPQQHVLDYDDAVLYGENEADVLVMGSRYVRDLTLKQAQNIIRNRQADTLMFMQARDVELFWKIRANNLFRVMMDGGDCAALGTNISEYYSYDLIFKRELYFSSFSLSALKYSLLGGQAGLWNVLKSHQFLPYPYYHSMGNAAPFFIQFRNIFRNIAWNFQRNKVKPFPLGLENRMQGKFNEAPEYELCCIMRPHIEERKNLLDLLYKKKYPKMFLDPIYSNNEDVKWMVDRGAAHPVATKIGGIGFANNTRYFNQLNNSRISISIPGGGFDTLRFWEILGQGSLLISKRITIQMPNSFHEGIHYLAFDTLSELDDVLEWTYNHSNEVDRIRKAGHEYALNYHSSEARARYFIDEVRKLV